MHTPKPSEFKEISKNNPNFLLPILKVLFDTVQYIKYSDISLATNNELFEKFSTNSICLFLSEELTSFGWLCLENEMQQPIKCLFAFGYLFSSFVICKLMQTHLYFTNPILIPLNDNLSSSNLSSINTGNIHDCNVVKHKIGLILKQINTLSEQIAKKQNRLKEATKSKGIFHRNSDLPIEIMHLLKNPASLDTCLKELQQKNDFLQSICDWSTCETAFTQWLTGLQSAIPDDIPPTDNDQFDDLSLLTDTEVRKCREKLHEYEHLANAVDRRWFELVNESGDCAGTELVCQLNAQCFVESCRSNLADSISIHCDSSLSPESLAGANRKLSQKIAKIDEKFRNKATKLAEYTDGLVLDGSKQ